MMLLVACGALINEKIDLTDKNALDSGDNDTILEEKELTWPKDRLPASVPRLKGITITDIVDNEKGILITFKDCDTDETKMYINKLKGKGWAYKTSNTEVVKIVTASRQNENLVFTSSKEDGIGSISYSSTD